MMKLKLNALKLILLGTILVLILYIVWPHFFLHEESPGADTRSELSKLEICFIMYRNKKSKWPSEDKWREEVASFLAESSSDFNEVGFFSDQWGNDIDYKVQNMEGNKRYILYSFGPNGKDDDGQGDDICIELKNIQTMQ